MDFNITYKIKLMKKLFYFLLLFTYASASQAQVVSAFPTEKDKFLKALDDFMKINKLENCSQAVDEFQAGVKKGEINDQQMAKIIETSNVMLSRVMSPFPYFYNYLSAVNAFTKAKGDPAKFTSWSDIAIQTAKNKAKGDNKEFLKFAEFSNAFFSKGAVNTSSAKTWKVESASYSIGNSEGKVKVSFPASRFVGYTNRDTIIINNTSGDYYPLENKWIGKGGKVDWAKAGVSSATVYANVKGEYTLNLDNFIITIDTVEFFHKEYFPTALYGKYSDKFGTGDTASSTFPRFDSKDLKITIKDLAPNVSYTGGFNFYGNRVIGYGTPEEKASVTFYKSDKVTKVLTAYFTEFPIKKNDELSSQKAQILLFNGKDTIFHPELVMIYKVKTRQLKLMRGQTAMSQSKFIDTYHNHEFDADAIFWNLDSTRIQIKTLEGSGKTGSNFESNNFFDKNRIRKLQGVGDYEPLSVIKRLFEKTGSRALNADEVAKAFDSHLTEQQAKSIFYELVKQGFIIYDESTSTILVRDKVMHYVMSNAKKKDYDIIRIQSIPKDGNDYIDLKNNNIELKGVKYVPISDTAGVSFYPANNFVKIQKDRNMEFDGMIYGGRMDFFGNNYHFKYDSFYVGFQQLDSLRINIPDGDKVDANNQPLLKTLRTNIEGIAGRMDVDLPINKSGRARLMQYPRLISTGKSFAYYADREIAGGAYKKQDFFFEIDPFRLDSLNSFSVQSINWKGKLVSGGIFPDIPESIKVQDDLSLGFTTEAPTTGWDTYKGGGKYKGDVTLDYRGLTGKGDLTHLTSSMSSHQINFYLDSMIAIADTFHIAKVSDGVKTPDVSSGGNRVFWKPKSDSMLIAMKDRPFSMYDNQTSLKGNLLLTSKGLKGNGALDWKEALLSSKEFNFKTDDMNADTAELNIKSEFGDKVTFKTPNVKAFVDFKNKQADFKSNLPNNPTEFAYNQYKTNIKEFKWDIEKKILDFRVPAGSPGEYFESTRASQLGLKFLSKRATYNLQTSILRCEQVSAIYVADAVVIPDSGIVVIQSEAKMDQLKHATILADTITKRHKIEDCTLDIISKAELKGNGFFKYSCKDHPNQPIVLSDITCKKEVVGLKKNQFTDYSLVAKGNIETKDNFYLYPNATYIGEASLFGRNPDLFFKGFAKLLFKNPNVTNADFNIIDDINPDKFFFHYDSIIKSSDGTKLGMGLYFDKSGDMPSPYSVLFSPLHDYNDIAMFRPVGVITQNEKTGEYSFGDEKRIKGDATIGDVLKYDDIKGIVKAEGGINLPVDFGLMKTVAVGSFINDLAKRELLMNVTFGLDMNFDNKSIQEKLQNVMYVDNTDMPDIDYTTERFKTIYQTLAKDEEKLIKEFETTQQFKRPKSLPHYLVFSDVNFIYDPVDFTFRSYGKIGVSFIGERAIHKKLEGYIEIGPRQGADYFNIYIKTGNNEWYYFEYKPGLLGMVSSYDDFNRTIGAVAPDKRKVMDKNNKFFTYTIGSTINKQAFVDAMKEKTNPSLPNEKVYVKPKPPMTAKDSAAAKAKLEQKVAPEKKPDAEVKPTETKPVENKTEEPVAVPEKKKEEKPEPPKSRADKLKEKYGTKDENPSPTVPPVAPTSQDTVTKSAPTVVPITTDTVKKTDVPVVTPPIETPVKIETPVVPSVTDTVKKTIVPVTTPPAETPAKSEAPQVPPATIDSVKKIETPVIPTTPVDSVKK
jgi:hypothetical protein